MSNGISILVYHSIDDSGSPISVSPRQFRDQMVDLSRRGCQTLSLEQLAEIAVGPSMWPARGVAIIFDDALETLQTNAWPILRSYDFRASVAVVTSRVGKDNAWLGQPKGMPRMRVLGWNELAQLRDNGWGFISHSNSHPWMNTLSSERIVEELESSIECLKKNLGVRPNALAYPYGEAPAGSLDEVARRFAIAFSGGNRQMRPGDHPHLLPRIEARYYLPSIPPCRPGSPWFDAYLGVRTRLRSLVTRPIASRENR